MKKKWLKEEAVVRLDKFNWRRAVVLKEGPRSYAVFEDAGTYSTIRAAKKAATGIANGTQK